MFVFSSIANLQDFRMKSLQSQLKMLALDQFQKVQFVTMYRECVRNLDQRVQKVMSQRSAGAHSIYTIVLKASKSAGSKGDVPKICGFVNPLHPL